MTEQRLAPTRQLTEVADCLEAMATGKGGWAWADVLDELRAIINGPEVKPFAYYVYFPDAQDGEFCDDLDDLIDRMTNERHEVPPLFSASPSAPVARCHECGKLASEGWALYCVECAEKIGPVQAVPGGWQLINRTPTPDQRELMLRADDFTVDELWIMLLATAPQPPATAPPSAVARPLVDDPEGRN